MIFFRGSADPHSVDVIRIGPAPNRPEERIGMLQWHPERPPRLVVESGEISLDDLRILAAKFEELAGR